MSITIEVSTDQVPEPGTLADPEAIQAAFKLALDQYTRNLDFTIDISQKLLGLVLAFMAIFYSIHKPDGDPKPLAGSTFWIILGVSAVSIIFFLVMQAKYFRRCNNCLLLLKATVPVAHPFGLSSLGILDREHLHIILMWSTVFLLFLAAMLSQVAYYYYHGTNQAVLNT